MFIIDYNLTETDFEKTDFSKYDEMDFRYNFFTGNLIFETTETKLILDWEWIPIYDFALSLIDIKNELNNFDKECSFEFTEAEDLIFFAKKEAQITISFSFSKVQFYMSLEEFNKAVENFCLILNASIIKNHTITKNPFWKNLSPPLPEE